MQQTQNQTAAIPKKAQKQISKYQRKPKEVSRVIIQPRDAEIIKLAYDYRFINSDQIKALVEGSGQTTIRRLRQLFHHSYLDRPRQQIRFTGKGPEAMIYGLANKGADVLAEEFGIDRGKIDWAKKNKEVKEIHIFHTTMISQIRAVITLAAKRTSDVEIPFWVQEGGYSDFVITSEKGRQEKIPIVPDGFFCLKYKGNPFFFFLEADQSTMTNSRFFKKLKGYWNYWKEGGHTKKYGFNNFRVLTITKTKARRDNLCKAAKDADDKQKGSQLFWFVCQDQFLLEDPQKALFEPIWKTPREEKLSLLRLKE